MHNNKPSLLLVDVSSLHRQRIKMRLDVLYDVTDFATLADALKHARRYPPSAMVICEGQSRGEDFHFLKIMRLEPAFSTFPIIVILAEANHAQSNRALQSGATSCLEKPYAPSVLMALISNGLSQVTERKWQTLPLLQAEALKSTVAIFSSISNMIAAGQPIIYTDVTAACVPLLAAVSTDGIKGILQGVRDHDNYTYAHSLRVAVYLSFFGHNIGLSVQDQSVLATGGLLHDLGKTLIPALTLNKPGNLTDSEYTVMKGHVPATIKLLDNCPELPRGVLAIAGLHHEKLDGSGYPNGLKGSELNELARMAAIADIFVALTDRRVYRPAMEPTKAFTLMAEDMTSQLDMRLLASFRNMFLDIAMTTA